MLPLESLKTEQLQQRNDEFEQQVQVPKLQEQPQQRQQQQPQQSTQEQKQLQQEKIQQQHLEQLQQLQQQQLKLQEQLQEQLRQQQAVAHEATRPNNSAPTTVVTEALQYLPAPNNATGRSVNVSLNSCAQTKTSHSATHDRFRRGSTFDPHRRLLGGGQFG